jgi:tetratricopeptide (TPR) repeat protein
VYTTRQVSQLLQLPIGQVREYARSGFLSPSKDTRGAYRFGFQDLVLLRAVAALTAVDVSHCQVRRTLGHLKTQLEPNRSLTEVRIAVVAGELMAQDGDTLWQPDSGQLHMNFAAGRRPSRISLMDVEERTDGDDDARAADQWYERGCELEPDNPLGAIDAYRHTLARNPHHADAHINLGRLLHCAGNASDAARHYRTALQARPTSATAAFNLGVALEDLDQQDAAIDAYECASILDPEFPDPHFNLAALCEARGDTQAALRHLREYKELIRTVPQAP